MREIFAIIGTSGYVHTSIKMRFSWNINVCVCRAAFSSSPPCSFKICNKAAVTPFAIPLASLRGRTVSLSKFYVDEGTKEEYFTRK